MTQFEFISVLISIVLGLGASDILSSCVVVSIFSL
jgi:hypothetical protein